MLPTQKRMIAALLTGIATGAFAWPSLFFMGTSWPIVPVFWIGIGVLWWWVGGKAALSVVGWHFLGAVSGYALLLFYILYIQQ